MEKIKELRKRHKTSLTLETSCIISTENGWNIMSSKNLEMYTIEQYDNKCTCQLSCIECGCCIHKYRCSCIDSVIKWNMCKHIYLLCLLVSKSRDHSQNAITTDLGKKYYLSCLYVYSDLYE